MCQNVQGECVRRCKVSVSEGARWVLLEAQGCGGSMQGGCGGGAGWVWYRRYRVGVLAEDGIDRKTLV